MNRRILGVFLVATLLATGILVGDAAEPAEAQALIIVDQVTDPVATGPGAGNGDGFCSLREAIESANTNVAVDGCAAGADGVDVIRLPAAGTILLTDQGDPETAALVVTTDLNIEGMGATIDGQDLGFTAVVIEPGELTPTDVPTVVFSDLIITRSGQLDVEDVSTGTEGGAILSVGTTTLRRVKLLSNKGEYGAGIETLAGGSTEIYDSVISFNEASMGGGGVDLFGGTVKIFRSEISHNTATFGAGVNNDGNDGDSLGLLEIVNSTLSQNDAVGDEDSPDGGHDVRNAEGGLTTLLYSTIKTSQFEPAIVAHDLVQLAASIVNGGVVVADTSSDSAPTAALQSTSRDRRANRRDRSLVAHQLGDPSEPAPLLILSGGYNVFDRTPDLNLAEGDMVTSELTRVLLGPLEADGDAPQTHALLLGPTGIDHVQGTPETFDIELPTPLLDQRGFERVGVPDAGAFEGHTCPQASDQSADSEEDVSLRIACYNVAGPATTTVIDLTGDIRYEGALVANNAAGAKLEIHGNHFEQTDLEFTQVAGATMVHAVEVTRDTSDGFAFFRIGRGSFAVHRSTLAGSGIFAGRSLLDPPQVEVHNSTIAFAPLAVEATSGATILVTSSTTYESAAVSTHDTSPGIIELRNSLLLNSPCTGIGTFVDLGGNISGADCGPIDATVGLADTADADIDDNGCVTADPTSRCPFTLRIDADSPAVDGDRVDCPAEDQRGFPRVVGCDAGSYENQAPLARPDMYFTDYNTTLEVNSANGPFANDIDPEGDPMTFSFTQPDHGTVTMDDDGAFVYVPEDGFIGLATFEFGIADRASFTVFQDVEITVDPPLIAHDDEVALIAPAIASIEVTANDTTAFGEPIVSVTASNGSQGTTSVDPASFVVTYTPQVSSSSIDTFSYEVCDSSTCASGTVTVAITPPTCADAAGSKFVATMWGTDGNDTIVGTDGADVIVSFAGDDDVSAGLGDDLVCAGEGSDTVRGEAGSDIVFGDAGDDKLFGAQGHDVMSGGPGDDTLHGNRGNDTLSGGDGNDRIFGYANNDTIDGGDGNDKLHGNFGDDRVDGGAGDDGVFGYGDDDELFGGPGEDVVGGNFGDDVLHGGADDDRMYGSDGTDEVNGDEGNDLVQGNSGNDMVNGGPGDDTLDGGINVDTCNGGPGTDTETRCETVSNVP